MDTARATSAPRRHVVRWLLLSALLIAPIASTAGCFSTSPDLPPAGEPVGSYLGGTLESASVATPPDAEVLVQDVSAIAGKDPTYRATFFGSPEWLVLALCADERTLEESASVEIAVVRAADASRGMVTSAREGAFRNTVTCDSRPHGSSPD